MSRHVTQPVNAQFLSDIVAALRGDCQATDAVGPSVLCQHSGFHSTDSEVGYPLVDGNGGQDGADDHVSGDCSTVGMLWLSIVVCHLT